MIYDIDTALRYADRIWNEQVVPEYLRLRVEAYNVSESDDLFLYQRERFSSDILRALSNLYQGFFDNIRENLAPAILNHPEIKEYIELTDLSYLNDRHEFEVILYGPDPDAPFYEEYISGKKALDYFRLIGEYNELPSSPSAFLEVIFPNQPPFCEREQSSNPHSFFQPQSPRSDLDERRSDFVMEEDEFGSNMWLKGEGL